MASCSSHRWVSLIFIWLAGLTVASAGDPPRAGGFGFARPINPQWLPDDSRQWSRVAESVFITDFSQIQPRAAITHGMRVPGKWKLLPFETDELSGQALSAYMDTDPEDARVALNASGRHAVYVGLVTTSGGISKATRNGLKVRLGRETVARRMANNLELVPPRRDVIQEQFFDVCELRPDDELVLATLPDLPATVAYVRLVPLTETEWGQWHEDKKDTRRDTSIFTADGGSWLWPYEPRSADDLRGHFRGMQETDAGKWWFQIGADQVYYPSKVGTLRFDGVLDFHKPLRRAHAEAIRALLAQGINPLRVARDAAREQGSEFHVALRTAAWGASYPFEETFVSKFYEAHPEWRCVDYEGKRIMYMSYAVPEVRAHVVAMLREAVEMVDPEGVALLFTRGEPMVLFEPAFLAEFEKKHGVDARTLPEEDSRILAVRAGIITGFLREIRAMLDEVGAARGRDYALSVAPFSNEPGNRRFGFDVAHWIREGMIADVVIAVNSHFVRGPRGAIAPPDIEYYKKIAAGTKVKLYPMVVAAVTHDSKSHAATVADYLRRGADGIAVWDPVMEAKSAGAADASTATAYRGNTMDLLAYMGHRELFEYWEEHGVPAVRSFRLNRLGDNTYSKWYPNTGY